MDQTPRDNDKAFSGRLSGVLSRYYPLLIGIVLVLSALLGRYIPVERTHQPVAPSNASSIQATETKPSNMVRVSLNATSLPYEEFPAEDLEERVRRTDFLLYETLDRQNATDSVHLLSVEVKRHQDRDFHFQLLELAPPDADRFLADFRTLLAEKVPNSTLMQLGEKEYLVSLDGRATHRLSLTPLAAEPLTIAARPKMAIVIDDLGEDRAFARQLTGLGFPVAFSVWPYSTHRTATVRLARESGNDILVHQPMEPQGWPTVNPGKGSVYMNMTRQDIRRTIRNNLARIPEAQGMNNHMGSRFTQWPHGMRAVMEELKVKNVYFLDSRTTPRSTAREEAGRFSVPLYRRNIFLDNVAEERAILHQLRKTERIALSSGEAVAIGHPHPATMQALRTWARERDRRVTVVKLSELSPE